MSFNIKKCAVLTITRKRNPHKYQYDLCNEKVPRVDHYKYLGVTVTSDLRWNKHCQSIRQKASRTLGLIRRTLPSCSREVKARAYTALVRPQLEYGSEVWNPYSTTVMNGLEQIQKTAARFVCCDYNTTTSTSNLVRALHWDQLHTRRLLAQCLLFYKIHYHLINISFPPIIMHAHYYGRHDHNLKYVIPEATIDAYKYSFYPRSVRIWNRLPSSVVNTSRIDSFKEVASTAIRTMQPPVGFSIM